MNMMLTLPLPPNMANSRMHWAAKHKKRAAYMLECDVRRAATNPRAPEVPIEFATATVVMRVARLHDHDNAMARIKWALDWLVTRKYIRNDDPRHLSFSGLPQQVIDRKNQGITITLEAS